MTLRTACVLIGISALAAAASAQTPDGFRTTPTLGWKSGDHRIDLGFLHRSRVEYYDAFVDQSDTYGGFKTRLKAQYGFRDQLIVTAEGQFIQLVSMDSDASGAELTYRNANDGRTEAGQFMLRQANVEWRPIPELYLRGGRQDIKLGTEVAYTEPDWRYLKTARLAERLIGNVGWSHVERANDAFTGGYDFGGHRLDVFAARPTTGVFEVDEGMRPLHDILYGGGIWTVKRGTWLDDTELGFFALGFDDDRPVDEGGLADGLNVATIGASWLGVYEIGPGNFDALLWAAGQFGTYDGDDHMAAAGIAEFGYRLPEVFLQPWLRAGVNVASGDGNANDDEHETFANLLPTNHLYYGFADQFAFQNLVNPFVQLRLTPHERFWFNLFAHFFFLANRDDSIYAGTGAFDRSSFGFPARASGGQSDAGVEYDITATWVAHRTTTLEVGFSYLDGGDVFRTRDSRNVTFAYASIEFRY